jgi:hypothetical protein
MFGLSVVMFYHQFNNSKNQQILNLIFMEIAYGDYIFILNNLT